MYNYRRQEMPKTEKIENGKIEPNIELLTKILYIQAPTKNNIAQQQLAEFLMDWINTNAPGCIMSQDAEGSLYVTKGNSDLYPCVVAHLDTAQEFKQDWEVIIGGKFIYGFDNITGEQCGIGADDKAGILFNLQMLQKMPVIKAYFPTNEESSCIGSSKANMDFFKDCTMLVQLDRNNYHNDLIEYTNGVQVLSEEFKTAVTPLMKSYNYDFNDGSCTDIGQLAKNGAGIIAMNVSCAYFNEHMDNEVISINHMYNAFNFVYDILTTFGNRKWEHKAEPKQFIYTPGSYEVGRNYGINDRYTQKWDLSAYDDFYDEIDYSKKNKKWHYIESVYNYSQMDDIYIDDMLCTGVCPLCESRDLHELYDGETMCIDCGSIYNIAEGKSMIQVDNDVNDYLSELDMIEEEKQMEEEYFAKYSIEKPLQNVEDTVIIEDKSPEIVKPKEVKAKTKTRKKN